jgi:hypothetical protein
MFPRQAELLPETTPTLKARNPPLIFKQEFRLSYSFSALHFTRYIRFLAPFCLVKPTWEVSQGFILFVTLFNKSTRDPFHGGDA